jgi:hypothetical protein
MMFIRVPVEKIAKTAGNLEEQRHLSGRDLLKNQDSVVQEVLAKLTDGVL